MPASGIGTSLAEAANLTGAPNPSELAPSAGDEWRFSFHGYFRAPMRIGIGSRAQCPAGTPAGTAITPGGMLMPATGVAQVPCAGPGQSTTALHTPFVPDSQYLDWRYDRQQEYDWTELFFNYGNSLVTGTVAIDAFGFSDAEYIAYSNASTQLGIAQGFLTIHPDLGSKFRVEAKIGSFWDKFGMAGEYDAGKYDTYMFGRTHQMGERIALEYDVGDLTLRLSHGIGTRAEQLAFTQLQAGNPTLPSGNEDNYPGFTLLNHAHAGISYKKLIDFNVHYLSSWAQDYRAVGVNNAQMTDGHIDVYGAEVRVKPGGIGGRLYGAYSHISASNPQAVGPLVEAVHSLGGGNYESGNGVLDNFPRRYHHDQHLRRLLRDDAELDRRHARVGRYDRSAIRLQLRRALPEDRHGRGFLGRRLGREPERLRDVLRRLELADHPADRHASSRRRREEAQVGW